ncbi:exotoxin beta-grasp domain-containing protein [Staphylococcus hyicus]|uniref:exotoxin beta-grasp domain-containing protein n=1 Tax=Staphylococcus hyicus TaxID=1284 RepID=UPI0037361CA7
MKLSTIAKTSLALGILTTGVMTTYAQSADAEVNKEVKNHSQDVQNLYDYYTKKPLELRDVKGYFDGKGVTVLHDYQHSEVELKGNDKGEFTDEKLKDMDVFIVGEGTGRQAPTRSIGGITKPNSTKFKDQVSNPQLYITKDYKDYKLTLGEGPFNIHKEQVSLKELDFKLRKHLIDKHGLYSNDKKNGTIVVKMQGNNENDKYTFELDKKLQDHRMGDVIDSRKIEKITVEL